MALSGPDSTLAQEMAQVQETVEQWRAVISQGNHPQLDCVDKVIRSAWLANAADLLIGPGVSSSARLRQEWVEVIVLAILWSEGPGALPSEVIFAIPAQVSFDLSPDSYVSVAAYANTEALEEEGEEKKY
eukprot:4879312-Amphidinium_carterae.1